MFTKTHTTGKEKCLLMLFVALINISNINAQTTGDTIQSTRVLATEQTTALQLEYKKLELEKFKIWLTALSIFIPAVIAIVTLAWQTREAARVKHGDTKKEFQLKAAEIVLSSSGPAAARKRAEVLGQLFKEHLPPNFDSSFRADILPGEQKKDKLEFLKLVSAPSANKQKIISLWKLLYPTDKEWLKEEIEQV